MISHKKLLAALSFIALIMLPAVVFPDVRIVLKNGRSITAYGCQEKAAEFVCSRAGGFFTLKKGEVAEIGKIPLGDAASDSEPVTESPAGGSVPGKLQVEKKGGRRHLQTSQSALQKRLAEITQRKREVSKERTKLIRDRERLRTDLKKTPDWMTTNRYSKLSGRTKELNDRIHRYNDEVSRLNTEARNIENRLKGKSGQPEERPGQD